MEQDKDQKAGTMSLILRVSDKSLQRSPRDLTLTIPFSRFLGQNDAIRYNLFINNYLLITDTFCE